MVSEVMLQQTQVARVVPKWTAFLARFPSPPSCADAGLAEVLSLWSGLGYPRRARNLWLAAQRCVAEHGGVVPSRLDQLTALPGVGAYTARAVLAFAFEDDVGVVDTNIARTLARHAGQRLGRGDVQRRADALVPRGRAWEWNQALMDVGAALCRPGTPRCGDCPLSPFCLWSGAGHPRPDPAAGSAGVSARQPPFAGSDRQGRGRLMAALLAGEVADVDLAPTMGWPEDEGRAVRVASGLVADGLVAHHHARYRAGS